MAQEQIENALFQFAWKQMKALWDLCEALGLSDDTIHRILKEAKENQ